MPRGSLRAWRQGRHRKLLSLAMADIALGYKEKTLVTCWERLSLKIDCVLPSPCESFLRCGLGVAWMSDWGDLGGVATSAGFGSATDWSSMSPISSQLYQFLPPWLLHPRILRRRVKWRIVIWFLGDAIFGFFVNFLITGGLRFPPLWRSALDLASSKDTTVAAKPMIDGAKSPMASVAAYIIDRHSHFELEEKCLGLAKKS